MHLNGSQCWFLGSKTSSIQYKTKDCNMYLFLNVSFHSLTKIESNSSQIRFFFSPPNLPNILTKRNDTVWCRRTKTRWVITPPTRLSVQCDPAAEWTMNIKKHHLNLGWLRMLHLTAFFFFFFPTFPFGQNFCAVNYSVQLFVCSHCEQHVWQLALFVLIVDWGVLITSPSID